MTEYPVTDPAEIGKLPDDAYLGVDGHKYARSGETWIELKVWLEFNSEDIAQFGGIACRLVPGTQRDALAELLREASCELCDCPICGSVPRECEWCDKREAALAKLEANDA